MKNYSLKTKLLTFFTAIFIGMIFVPAKANVINIANEMLSKAEKTVGDFLDLNKPGNYKDFGRRLKPMLEKIENLTSKYSNDQTPKGRAIYNILQKLHQSFNAVYKVFMQNYTMSITFGLALKKIVSTHLSKSKIQEIQRDLTKLTPLLSDEEKAGLKKLMHRLQHFSVQMPSNPISLLSARMKG